MAKKPHSKRRPSGRKAPRSVGPRSILDKHPIWSFGVVDPDGPWCFGSIDGADLVQALQRLGTFETMTWADIERDGGSHPVPCTDITSQAQKRLVQIDQDDLSHLYSLRITGRQRVWGIRDHECLRILWWDPRHEVCPSHKRHT